jgi:hypothetical protein
MRTRMTWSRRALVSSAIITLAIAVSSVQPAHGQAAQAKADECLARPGASAPKGSHWYYRIERPTQRRCWYLGAANQRVRAEQAAPAERRATPAPEPGELRPDEQAPVETPPAVTAGAGTATSGSVPAMQFSVAWPAVSNAAGTSERSKRNRTTADTDDEADVAIADAQPEDMPLVWPVLSPADRAAAESANSAPGIGHLLIFFAAATAFVAIAFRLLREVASSRRGNRYRPAPRPAGPVIRPRAPERTAPEGSIEAMSEPAIARLREIARRWDASARVPRQPPLPASEVWSDDDIKTARRRRAVA